MNICEKKPEDWKEWYKKWDIMKLAKIDGERILTTT